LFSTRRNYLSAGTTIEVNPLVSAGPTLIANLDDGSVLLLASAPSSLGDNLTLVAGARHPLAAAERNSAASPWPRGARPSSPRRQRLYLQLRRYF
jgi:hypothetical protein